MTTRAIRHAHDITTAVALLEARKLPFTLTIADGLPRSNRQNRTQRLWLQEAADQLGDESAEDKRAWCKLHLGVGILKAENEEWAEKYLQTLNEKIQKLESYEGK